MAIPECTKLPSIPQTKEIQFPGGARLSQVVAAGNQIPDALDAATNLLSQANAALSPLLPVLDILDTVLALVDCIKAVPDALGPPPDPTGVADCIPALSEKVGKLLALVPQLSLPKLIVDVLDCVIQFLEGAKATVEVMLEKATQLLAAQFRAAELSDPNLENIVQCANDNLTIQLEGLNRSLEPITRLLSIINGFLELLGLPTLPELAKLDPDDLEAALATLDSVVDAIRTVRDQVPIP